MAAAPSLLMMLAAALLLVTLTLPCATAAKECGPKCTARYNRMVDLREESSVIRVRADTFKELIRTGPRNYSVVLLLNAESPKRGCQPCLAAAGVYQAVADSFYAQHPSARNEVFFASADYDSGGEEIFQKMDCKSAPVFFYIKPEGQPVRSLAQMYEADEIAIYIQKATGRKFTVKRPVDVTKVIITLSVFAAIAFVVKTFWSVVHRVISNPSLWAYIAITFALMMMGGQMWMQIRGAPFTQPTQDGSMTLYHGSSSYQYGIEVILVMVLQGGVTIGAVILGDHAPNLKGNLQRTTTLIGVGMVIGIFSLLYRVFREKYGGYPYKLLF